MRVLFLLALAITLGACSTLSDVLTSIKEEAPPKIAKTVDAYCATQGTDIARRKSMLNAVNAHTEKGDLVAIDCDQDGQPDF